MRLRIRARLCWISSGKLGRVSDPWARCFLDATGWKRGDDGVGELPIAAFAERGVLHIWCMRDTQYAFLIPLGVNCVQSMLGNTFCSYTNKL
jgi:hypothetical protein